MVFFSVLVLACFGYAMLCRYYDHREIMAGKRTPFTPSRSTEEPDDDDD